MSLVGVLCSAGSFELALIAIGSLADELLAVDGVLPGWLVEFHGLPALCFGEHCVERALDERDLELIVMSRPRVREQSRGHRFGAAR